MKQHDLVLVTVRQHTGRVGWIDDSYINYAMGTGRTRYRVIFEDRSWQSPGWQILEGGWWFWEHELVLIAQHKGDLSGQVQTIIDDTDMTIE